MSVKLAALQLDARLKGDGDIGFCGVSTDTRDVGTGQLFVALQGPNFDGHDFVPQAVQQQAAAVMVSRPLSVDVPQIIVPDTLLALGKLAAFWRRTFLEPVIGVTGSNGKTSVKELLATVFSQKGRVFATQGNFNNHIGLPLMLLRLEELYEFAIIEMGANHPKEIEYLTGITRPDIALITNAGPAHLEGFGTIEGVAKSKGEIYQGLAPGGVAVINADDKYAPIWFELASPYRQIRFGMKSQTLQQGRDVIGHWQQGTGNIRLQVSTPKGEFACSFSLMGEHNVMNALAATAVACAAELPLDLIKQGLEKAKPVAGRLQPLRGINGCLLINDTYNANPNSLEAGMDVLVAGTGRKILVMGDMGELGEDTVELHRRAGEQAGAKGVDLFLGIGGLTRNAVSAFPGQSQHFDDYDALVAYLKENLVASDSVLVKGSRSMHMETVVNGIAEQVEPEVSE